MSILDDVGNVVGDAANDAAEAGGQIVDAVVDAATGQGSKSEEADDDVANAVLWIIDSAIALTAEAAAVTKQAVTSSAAKAEEAAECQRTWAVVAAVVAVVVVIIVAVVASLFTFGAGGALVAFAVMAACAILGGIIAAAAAASMIQAAVIAAVKSITILTSAATTRDERKRIGRDAVENLKRAMSMIQAAAAQRLPASKTDRNRSLVAVERTSRAMQKLLSALRRAQLTPRMALIVSRLGQLDAALANLATQLRAPAPIKVPVVGAPGSPGFSSPGVVPGLKT